MSILRIGRTYRSLRRLRHIVQVITKHGLGSYIDRLHLSRYIPIPAALVGAAGYEGRATTPKRIVKILEELGPTTVKFGQMLASRPDILPNDYQKEFSLLHDRVKPFPGKEARRIVEQELGKPIQELFASFNEVPAASASIAQVHEAVLLDGTPVMVKVRRPKAEETIRADLDLLRALADLIKKYIPESRVFRPKLLVEEFARNIRKELDFVDEAAYTSRFHEEFLNDEKISIPRVHWDMTSSAVLTLERLDGVKISDIEKLREMGIDTKKLASDLGSVFTKQYFEMGIFHGDPHPGNILVTSDGKLSLIDFGLVGHVSRDLREQLITTFIALDRDDFDTIVDVYTEMGVASRETDFDSFKHDLIAMAGRYYGIPARNIDIRHFFADFTYVARQNNILLPRDLILLGKSMAMLGSITRNLDPDFNLAAKAESHTKKLIEERWKPENIVDRTATGFWHSFRLFNTLPRDVGQIVHKLRTGTLEIVFRHEGLEKPVTELDRASNRLALSITLASVVVASSLIMNAKVGPIIPFTGLSIMGLAGFFLAAILGVWLVVAIFRSNRL